MEEGEARFVAHMEEVQVKECKKAVFAPTSLATMVLSTVFELQREFPISKEDGEDEDEDDEEEEEEVTLAVLGTKRKTASKSGNNSKRPRQSTVAERRVSFQYLLRMLQHISKVWGHVYREPSHEDFAWYVAIVYSSLFAIRKLTSSFSLGGGKFFMGIIPKTGNGIPNLRIPELRILSPLLRSSQVI